MKTFPIKDINPDEKTINLANKIKDKLNILGLTFWYSEGPDGMIFLCNDYNEHHFVIEIFSDGHVELFYRNRISEELWGEDFIENFSEEAIEKLILFKRNENVDSASN